MERDFGTTQLDVQAQGFTVAPQKSMKPLFNARCDLARRTDNSFGFSKEDVTFKTG